MRRLLPEPSTDVDLAGAYADPRRRPHDGRPWVLVNMVSSVDGATAIDGLSGDLGGPGDRAAFPVIRALADVILVGAATVRAERYGPPQRHGQRVAVVTRSAALDWSSPLFGSGSAMVVTSEDGPEVPVTSLRAGIGDVDLAAALTLLADDAVRVVLAEGGPMLNGQLLAAGLVDELCVTIAPRAVSGTAARLAVGPPAASDPWRLAQVIEHEGELLLRYLRR